MLDIQYSMSSIDLSTSDVQCLVLVFSIHRCQIIQYRSNMLMRDVMVPSQRRTSPPLFRAWNTQPGRFMLIRLDIVLSSYSRVSQNVFGFGIQSLPASGQLPDDVLLASTHGVLRLVDRNLEC